MVKWQASEFVTRFTVAACGYILFNFPIKKYVTNYKIRGLQQVWVGQKTSRLVL